MHLRGPSKNVVDLTVDTGHSLLDRVQSRALADRTVEVDELYKLARGRNVRWFAVLTVRGLLA